MLCSALFVADIGDTTIQLINGYFLIKAHLRVTIKSAGQTANDYHLNLQSQVVLHTLHEVYQSQEAQSHAYSMLIVAEN